MGPKRDIIGELEEATRQRGMVFCVSSHRAEHWWFFDGGRKFPSDVQDAQYDGLYGPAVVCSPAHGTPAWKHKDWQPRPDAKFLEDWLARCCEVVDKYQPQVFWFDWWIEQAVFEPYLQRFAAYYYNRAAEWGLGVAINHKFDSYPEGTAVFDIERGQLSGIRPLFWQTDTSVSKNSWGYIDDHDYKTAGDIIGDLVDIVSKNGALLLNIGPRADGTIPEPEQAMLREIGAWLAINGEAIYDTRHWDVYGEGPTEVSDGEFTDTKRTAFTGQDIRFTQKADALYAICLGWPDGDVQITSLGSGSSLRADQIAGVSMLGSDASLTWTQDASRAANQCAIDPAVRPCLHVQGCAEGLTRRFVLRHRGADAASGCSIPTNLTMPPPPRGHLKVFPHGVVVTTPFRSGSGGNIRYPGPVQCVMRVGFKPTPTPRGWVFATLSGWAHAMRPYDRLCWCGGMSGHLKVFP